MGKYVSDDVFVFMTASRSTRAERYRCQNYHFSWTSAGVGRLKDCCVNGELEVEVKEGGMGRVAKGWGLVKSGRSKVGKWVEVGLKVEKGWAVGRAVDKALGWKRELGKVGSGGHTGRAESLVTY